MLQAKAVTLNGLWVHLSPEDATLKELQQAAQASALTAYRSRNNLNKDIDQVRLHGNCIALGMLAHSPA